VGGAQERGRRAGTENVPGIVAMGLACELAREELEQESERQRRLRDRLETGILASVPNAYVNGANAERAPHILNVGFKGADGESLILALDLEGIAVSSGSACTAGSIDPSHVLLAMGQSHEAAQSALRFSLGRTNTDADIDRVLTVLPAAVQRTRRS
jgi:cysteine desulfurase